MKTSSVQWFSEWDRTDPNKPGVDCSKRASSCLDGLFNFWNVVYQPSYFQSAEVRRYRESAEWFKVVFIPRIVRYVVQEILDRRCRSHVQPNYNNCYLYSRSDETVSECEE